MALPERHLVPSPPGSPGGGVGREKEEATEGGKSSKTHSRRGVLSPGDPYSGQRISPRAGLKAC